MTAQARLLAWQTLLLQHWARRSRRERWLMGLTAAWLMLLALMGLAILPAWRTLKAAPAEHAQLNAQWQRMRVLQAQSAALLKQPMRAFNEDALRASLAPLGPSVQLHMGEQSAELRLNSTPPEALALWLLSSRRESGAVVREAQLQRNTVIAASGQSGKSGQGDQQDQTHWSGRLLLDLPR